MESSSLRRITDEVKLILSFSGRPVTSPDSFIEHDVPKALQEMIDRNNSYYLDEICQDFAQFIDCIDVTNSIDGLNNKYGMQLNELLNELFFAVFIDATPNPELYDNYSRCIKQCWYILKECLSQIRIETYELPFHLQVIRLFIFTAAIMNISNTNIKEIHRFYAESLNVERSPCGELLVQQRDKLIRCFVKFVLNCPSEVIKTNKDRILSSIESLKELLLSAQSTESDTYCPEMPFKVGADKSVFLQKCGDTLTPVPAYAKQYPVVKEIIQKDEPGAHRLTAYYFSITPLYPRKAYQAYQAKMDRHETLMNYENFNLPNPPNPYDIPPEFYKIDFNKQKEDLNKSTEFDPYIDFE